MATPTLYHHRARIAALSRDRAPDDPELIEARRALRAARIDAEISKAVETWPPLTTEQVDRLRPLLRTEVA